MNNASMNSTTTSNQNGMNHNGMNHGYAKPKKGSFVTPKAHTDDPVQKLIDTTQHTHKAVKSGSWSDPKTWSDGRVPGEDAKVLISKGVTVTYDAISEAALKTVAIEGDLKFATNKDTQLKVETILNAASGQLDVGSAAKSVEADKQARIIFTSDTSIASNAKWDPKQLTKGLVSHGTVNIYGADKADQLTLVGDASKGASVLKFQEAPQGWKVGDRIVLGGTEYSSRGKDSDNSRFQDEVLKVTSINGKEVRFVNEDIKGSNNNVLRFNHTRSNIAGSADKLSLYAANLSRNVSFETENGKDVAIGRRAHVMLMHNPNVKVLNAGFYNLGRSDKTKLVDDVNKNIDGSGGKGTNPRGRYALHLHRTGADDINGQAAIVRGNAVEGSPGWGIVQHDSHAGLEDNVVFDVVGAGIASEAGNEIGWWKNNMTIKTTGMPVVEFNRQAYVRDRLYDFGVQGSGFWVQGAAQIKNSGNKAISSNSAGLDLFGGALNRKYLQDATTLEISNLPPELRKLFPAGQKEVDIRDVPMATVEGFVSYNANTGLRVWGHKTDVNGELAFNTKDIETAHKGKSFIKDFTLWGNRFRGASVQYSSNINLDNGLVLGNENGKAKAFGAGLLNNQASYGTVFNDLTVAGFEVGVDVAKPNTDKEFISSTVSNSKILNNTYNLGEAGKPSAQGGVSDFAAFLQLKNNSFSEAGSNQAPTAEFGAEALGGLAFELDASESSDRDPLRGGNPNLAKLDSNGIAAYGWDLDNNGSVDRFGRNITHVFNAQGSKTVGLKVWDSHGKTATFTKKLNVAPANYQNAFVNAEFNSEKIQTPGNDNSQWADQGWYASRGVKVSNGAGKLSVRGDSSNYIGQVVRNDKVHQGKQFLSFDLKNIDAGKRSTDANEVSMTLWGVNGQFENDTDSVQGRFTGPTQVGTLPMERTKLTSKAFNKENNGLLDWKTISTEVNLGQGYDYLMFQVDALRAHDPNDFVAIDNLSLTGEANAGGGPSEFPETLNTGGGGPSEAPETPNAPSVPTPIAGGPSLPTEILPVARISFDEGSGAIAADTSSAGTQNDAQLKNASWIDGKLGEAARFSGGVSGASLKDSRDINLGNHKERTVSMWFQADDASSNKKQVIYEEGGRGRGLNMYVEDNLLYFGGWSNKGGWKEGDWVTTEPKQVKSGKWHHVALVLDGNAQLNPNALTAYFDGEKLGSTQGTQMWFRPDNIGIGNTSGSTRFADGTTGTRKGLIGGIDEVQIYNDALSGNQVQQLANGAFL